MAMVLGLITWLISHDAVPSLILAILVETVALILDLDISVTDEFERYSRASKLRSLLPATEQNGPNLLQYVEDYSNVTQKAHPLIVQYAQERALESVDEMRDLKEGRMEIGPSLVQVKGADILKDLKVSGFATALGHLYDFWLPESKRGNGQDTIGRGGIIAKGYDEKGAVADAAKRGYQLQGIDAARKRKISITRVFLLERADVVLPNDFVELIDDQNNAGIKVLVAYLDSLPADLGKDFGIWDDQIVGYVNWEHSVVPGPNLEPILTSTITGATYYTFNAELLRARRMRERILQAALTWESVRVSHVADGNYGVVWEEET
jgi:hypothetical protein